MEGVLIEMEDDEITPWAQNQQRFPERDVLAMTAERRLEHFAVHQALELAGWKEAHLKVIHNDHGRPLILKTEEGVASLFLSIAHHSAPGKCFALIALSKHPVGCDIEVERESLRGIATRVMNPEEGSVDSNLGQLCAVWCVKEAMFKAKGPGLDFRKDLSVTPPTLWPSVINQPLVLRGSVRNETGQWMVWNIPKSSLAMDRLWLSCGPL